MIRHPLTIALWLAFMLATPEGAKAERGASPEPREYKAAIASAIEEFEHDNFIEAREQFERAHALFPNARTFRGLGVTAFELRNYVETVSLLEQALASEIKRLDGELRTETQKLLDRARKYVGEVHLKVAPATASVIIDGVSNEASIQTALMLGVGDHVLEFRAPGHLNERRTIRVKGEQVQTLVVRLAEPSNTAALRPGHQGPSAESSPDRRGEAAPLYKRWWLWTAVGVVVAGAAVGTTLWLRNHEKTDYEPTTTANTPTGLDLRPLRRP